MATGSEHVVSPRNAHFLTHTKPTLYGSRFINILFVYSFDIQIYTVGMSYRKISSFYSYKRIFSTPGEDNLMNYSYKEE